VPKQFGDPFAERAVFDYLSELGLGQSTLTMELVNIVAKRLDQHRSISLPGRRKLVIEAVSCMQRRRLVLSAGGKRIKLGFSTS
jgi:hypothetical protein